MSNKPHRPPLDKGAAGDHDETIDIRLTRVETIVDAILKTLEALQRRLDESLLTLRADVRADMSELRADVRADMAELRAEMRTYTRWLIGLCATNTLALLAMLVKSGNFF